MKKLIGGATLLSALLFGAAPATAATCEKMLEDYTRAKADRAPLLGDNRPADVVARRDRLTRTMVRLRDEANRQGCNMTNWPGL